MVPDNFPVSTTEMTNDLVRRRRFTRQPRVFAAGEYPGSDGRNHSSTLKGLHKSPRVIVRIVPVDIPAHWWGLVEPFQGSCDTLGSLPRVSRRCRETLGWRVKRLRRNVGHRRLPQIIHVRVHREARSALIHRTDELPPLA